jgi:hypothetical protein
MRKKMDLKLKKILGMCRSMFSKDRSTTIMIDQDKNNVYACICVYVYMGILYSY